MNQSGYITVKPSFIHIYAITFHGRNPDPTIIPVTQDDDEIIIKITNAIMLN